MTKTSGVSPKPVSLKPSEALSSLYELFRDFRGPPDMEAARLHHLDFRLWDAVYGLGAALSVAANSPGVGNKGRQELSRYVMYDVAQMLRGCPEIASAKSIVPEVYTAIKTVKSSRCRRFLMGEIKRCASYAPLTPVSSQERYHLWAWDDGNMKEIVGVLSETRLPENILSAFAAGSLATLDNEVLGDFCTELREEYEHGMRQVRLYLARLLALKSEIDIIHE